MYPMTCAGGYPVPLKKGRFSVCGVAMAVNDTTAASRITLVDSGDFAVLTDSAYIKTPLLDLKGLANADGVVGIMFEEPIKVREGVCITNLTTNMLPGRTLVYIK